MEKMRKYEFNITKIFQIMKGSDLYFIINGKGISKAVVAQKENLKM